MRIQGHGQRLELVTQPQLAGVGALVQTVHDVGEVLVDVDVELLQGGHVVELSAVSRRELLHVHVQLLVRNLREKQENVSICFRSDIQQSLVGN